MLTIQPRKLTGEVICPPSKSIAHRAIICASLAHGSSIIRNLEYSDDIIATIEAMRQCGAKITIQDDECHVEGFSQKPPLHRNIDCNESGSTLRFMVPISTLFEGESNFTGRGQLGKRPLTPYFEIFKNQGVSYQVKEGPSLDLTVKGKLRAGQYHCAGNISSQFISGLLFTLPCLEGNSEIIIDGPLESKGYIDLTLSVLDTFGIEIVNDDYKRFMISGNQVYQANDYRVEGDYSQAAFFLVANALGNDINLLGLNKDSKQGDRQVIEMIDQLTSKSNLPIVIDASQCPDVIPVVSLLACWVNKEVSIINAGRLRIKECDRLTATCLELSKLGANIEENDDSIQIHPNASWHGGIVSSHQDHRMAMMLAIASTICHDIIQLDQHQCVSKSYPSFWEVFKTIGGVINE